jgi:hypothetical protein
MWNSLLIVVPLASMLTGTNTPPRPEAHAAPAAALAAQQGSTRLRITEVSTTREIGLNVGLTGLAVHAPARGTLGASYGLTLGPNATLEATLDLAKSARRIGGLGSARLLIRRPSNEGEWYVAVGAAWVDGIGVRGGGTLIGVGERFTITREIGINAELQLVMVHPRRITGDTAARAIVGVRVRK